MKTDKLVKDLQEDKEYLKRCLEMQSQQITIPRAISYGLSTKQVTYSPNWWASDNTVLTVAKILERYGQLSTVAETIDFFEKPYKFGQNMKFIIEEM